MTTKFSRLFACAAMAFFVSLLATPSAMAQAPKKLLVITVTKGFRHSSIPTAEKILAKLAEKSGAFTVDYVRNDQEMAEKMTAEGLKNYDGFVFANTTGILPLPDKAAFLDAIKGGKAFIGTHSASDTFHGKEGIIDPYIQMLGGEFRVHHAQAGIECLVLDPAHPATLKRDLGDSLSLEKEEVYLMTNYDSSKVHELLVLDKHPNDKKAFGRYPVAWCKKFGQGRVFYTSLGHREDIWDADWKDPKGKRLNSPEIADAFQKHLLGGIKWALGLEAGDATPQIK